MISAQSKNDSGLVSCSFQVLNVISINMEVINSSLIITSCKLSKLNFKIYNRYGDIVYKTGDLTGPLFENVIEDVKVGGEYLWIAEYDFCTSDVLISKTAKGIITILK
jgi:hypothetical protein